MSFQYTRHLPLKSRYVGVLQEKQTSDEQGEVLKAAIPEILAKHFRPGTTEAIYSASDPAGQAAGEALLAAHLKEHTGIDPNEWLNRKVAIDEEYAEVQPEADRAMREAVARVDANPKFAALLARTAQTPEMLDQILEAANRRLLDGPDALLEASVLALHRAHPEAFQEDGDLDLLDSASVEKRRLEDEESAERRRKYAEADGDANDKELARITREYARESGVITEKVGDGIYTVQPKSQSVEQAHREMLAELEADGATHTMSGTPLSELK